MKDATAATRLAERIVRARRERRQFAATSEGFALANAAEAYRVQDEVARALGWFAADPPGAWKAGAASPGATPTAAPLPPALVVPSPARFAAGTFHAIGIEAEIAVRFGVDVERSAAHVDTSALLDQMHVTIEIVDTRLSDAEAAGPLAKLADQQIHGALVVGDAVPFRSDVDWRSLRTTVRRNGKTIADVVGGHALGDPTTLLPWFIDHACERFGRVPRGTLVTLGTWVGLLPASAGDAIDATFEGIGSAAVRFD
jgi:2-keto-4-pentenoate hydratase